MRNTYFTLIIFRLIKANAKQSFPQEVLHVQVVAYYA